VLERTDTITHVACGSTEVVELLGSCQTFSRFWTGFSLNELEQLAKTMTLMRIAKGANIMTIGEDASFAGLLVTGSARVVDDDGKQRTRLRALRSSRPRRTRPASRRGRRWHARRGSSGRTAVVKSPPFRPGGR